MLDINDIRREQSMAEIIAERDLTILRQNAEMIKANDRITELAKSLQEAEAKLKEKGQQTEKE